MSNLIYTFTMQMIDSRYFERVTYHKIIPSSNKKRDRVTAVFNQALEAVATFFFRVVYLARRHTWETNKKLAIRLVTDIELRSREELLSIDKLFKKLILATECEELDSRYQVAKKQRLNALDTPLSGQELLEGLENGDLRDQEFDPEHYPFVLTDTILDENAVTIPIEAPLSYMELFTRGDELKRYDEDLFLEFAEQFRKDFPRTGLIVIVGDVEHDLSDMKSDFPMKLVSETLSEWVIKTPDSQEQIDQQLQQSPYREFMEFFKNDEESPIDAVMRFYRDVINGDQSMSPKLDRMLEVVEAMEFGQDLVAMKLIDFFCLLSQTSSAKLFDISLKQGPLIQICGGEHFPQSLGRRIYFNGDRLDQLVLEVDFSHVDLSVGAKPLYRETTRMTVDSIREGGEYVISTGNDYRFSNRIPVEWIPKISSAN